MRVGVHAGPVVAGVVGQERYQFDIWGDQRRGAHGRHERAGKRCTTKEIFDQIASAFDDESLGELNITGKCPISIVGLRAHKS